MAVVVGGKCPTPCKRVGNCPGGGNVRGKYVGGSKYPEEMSYICLSTCGYVCLSFMHNDPIYSVSKDQTMQIPRLVYISFSSALHFTFFNYVFITVYVNLLLTCSAIYIFRRCIAISLCIA